MQTQQPIIQPVETNSDPIDNSGPFQGIPKHQLNFRNSNKGASELVKKVFKGIGSLLTEGYNLGHRVYGATSKLLGDKVLQNAGRYIKELSADEKNKEEAQDYRIWTEETQELGKATKIGLFIGRSIEWLGEVLEKHSVLGTTALVGLALLGVGIATANVGLIVSGAVVAVAALGIAMLIQAHQDPKKNNSSITNMLE